MHRYSVQRLGLMDLSSTLDMDLTCVLLTATQEDPLPTVVTMIAGSFQLISWCAEVPSVDVSENTIDDEATTFDNNFL